MEGRLVDNVALERCGIDVEERHFLMRFELESTGTPQVTLGLVADIGEPGVSGHSQTHQLARGRLFRSQALFLCQDHESCAKEQKPGAHR